MLPGYMVATQTKSPLGGVGLVLEFMVAGDGITLAPFGLQHDLRNGRKTPGKHRFFPIRCSQL